LPISATFFGPRSRPLRQWSHSMNAHELPRSLPPKVDINPLLANQKASQQKHQSCLHDIKGIESEIRVLSRELKLTQLHLAYYSCASWLRYIVARTVGIRIGAAMILATLTGSVAVIIFRSPILTGIGAVVGLLGSISLLYWRPDDKLAQVAATARDRFVNLKQRRNDCINRLPLLQSRLSSVGFRISEILTEIQKAQRINSTQARREGLVRMNWKAMRGPELEGFLAVVFEELGYGVERIGASGDQGVDLIASKDRRRIAVQSKGYVDSVSNGAVQEAFAGMTFHGCNECVVITNSRFTSSAWELARRTNCGLIDENTLSAFIRGELDIHWSNRQDDRMTVGGETSV
jgi:hypothetical protein